MTRKIMARLRRRRNPTVIARSAINAGRRRPPPIPRRNMTTRSPMIRKRPRKIKMEEVEEQKVMIRDGLQSKTPRSRA
jgi:hypothetical protein